MNNQIPYNAEIIENIQETRSIYTLRLRFTDPHIHAQFQFAPGQFNMLYLYGGGEVPISIVSDPEDEHMYDHTIRAVGRITNAMEELKPGDHIGVRGPYGRGWPVQSAQGKDVVLVTGGLGCAPLVSVINYIVRRREQYQRLVIMQGVKHYDDLFWHDRYDQWSKLPQTQVILAASQAGPNWPFSTGHITSLLHQANFDATNSVAMLCGPEGMMHAAIDELLQRGVGENDIWISTERNMQCAVGQCGHCQLGPYFVCKDGPVFPYSEIKPYMQIKGL